MEPVFPARVTAIRYEAEQVFSFQLVPVDEHRLPAIDPGSHIDVHLPNGLMRSYSLSNGAADTGYYRLTIARDAKSKGGSQYLHEMLRPGQVIEISDPRNNFKLAEDAGLSVFIAGGIGITPFIPMLTRLNETGAAWRLHYCVRTRARAALIDELEALATASAGKGELVPNFDEEPGGVMLDLSQVMRELPTDGHVYCCGPSGMLDAFRAGAVEHGIGDERVHFEYFSSNVVASAEGGFTVVLNKSAKQVEVEPGQTILDALIGLGMDVPFSCQEGICGSCETRIIEGEADHRDMVLSDTEKAAGRTMMICCSGSKLPRLVLDL